jgi:tetrapyrrole methylase family protein/MazG family protein
MRNRRGQFNRRAARGAASFARLVRIMDTLRSRQGCPWDRKQTHQSLRPFLLEETYEALEAIDRRDWKALPGELGDVLLQCVFHAQLGAERGRFEIADAVDAINTKLVHRHPHVFTPAGRPLGRGHKNRKSIRTPAAVKEQWARIKAKETGHEGNGRATPRRVLDGVPRTLPALLRAHEIGTRVAGVGFDWSKTSDVVDKIEEEVHELREALNESPARAAEELGDLLFSVANLARKLNLEPESALREANDKFTRRFAAVEKHFEDTGRSVHDASMEEMGEVWNSVKRQ